jgi:phosphotransferase system IIB component
MNFVMKSLVYLLMLVFDVKTVVNDAEKLETCVTRIGASLTDVNESNANMLKLIDQSTVIVKAFCSENLINFVDDNDDELEVDERAKSNQQSEDDDDYYNDYYFYKNSEAKKLKLLMTFTPITIFKGTSILRQLELFNNQEYFLIKG